MIRRGDDAIRDFHAGEDEIDLSPVPGLHGFADLEPLISRDHGDTVIDFGWGNLTLQDVAPGDLREHDFVF